MSREKIIQNRINGSKLAFSAAFSAALVLIHISLYSCVSASGKNQPHVYFTNKAKYILLPASGIENPMDMAHYISASFQDQKYFFNAWVKADKTGIEMTMLNDLGVSMGILSYRDGFISLSSPVFPDSMQPEYIIADFQLCFYNPGLLRKELGKIGLVFEANETTRRILNSGNAIIEIEKTKSAVRLTNNFRGYSYFIEGDFQ